MQNLNQCELKGKGGGERSQNLPENIGSNVAQQSLVGFLVLFILSWYLGQNPAGLPVPSWAAANESHTASRCLSSRLRLNQPTHKEQVYSSPPVQFLCAIATVFFNQFFPHLQPRHREDGSRWFLLVNMDRAHVKKLPVMSHHDSCICIRVFFWFKAAKGF